MVIREGGSEVNVMSSSLYGLVTGLVGFGVARCSRSAWIRPDCRRGVAMAAGSVLKVIMFVGAIAISSSQRHYAMSPVSRTRSLSSLPAWCSPRCRCDSSGPDERTARGRTAARVGSPHHHRDRDRSCRVRRLPGPITRAGKVGRRSTSKWTSSSRRTPGASRRRRSAAPSTASLRSGLDVRAYVAVTS